MRRWWTTTAMAALLAFGGSAWAQSGGAGNQDRDATNNALGTPGASDPSHPAESSGTRASQQRSVPHDTKGQPNDSAGAPYRPGATDQPDTSDQSHDSQVPRGGSFTR